MAPVEQFDEILSIWERLPLSGFEDGTKSRSKGVGKSGSDFNFPRSSISHDAFRFPETLSFSAAENEFKSTVTQYEAKGIGKKAFPSSSSRKISDDPKFLGLPCSGRYRRLK